MSGTNRSVVAVIEEQVRATTAQDIFVAPTIAISGNRDLVYEVHYFVKQDGAAGGISYFLATANSTQFAGNSQQWLAGGTSITAVRDTAMIVGTNSNSSPLQSNSGIGWFPKISTANTTVRHCVWYGVRAHSTSVLLQSRVHSVTTPSTSTNLVNFGFDTNKNGSCGVRSLLRLLKPSNGV